LVLGSRGGAALHRFGDDVGQLSSARGLRDGCSVGRFAEDAGEQLDDGRGLACVRE
jgi:hypothetical protein